MAIADLLLDMAHDTLFRDVKRQYSYGLLLLDRAHYMRYDEVELSSKGVDADDLSVCHGVPSKSTLNWGGFVRIGMSMAL